MQSLFNNDNSYSTIGVGRINSSTGVVAISGIEIFSFTLKRINPNAEIHWDLMHCIIPIGSVGGAKKA